MKWNSGRLWLQISVYALLLIALFLGAALLYTAHLDTDGTKQKLERSLSDTGRVLKIHGDISPLLFPAPGLQITDLTLSETDGKTTFASIARAEARLAWLPLIFGKLEIDYLSVEGSNMRLVRQTDGKLNISDLLQRRQQTRFQLNLDAFALQINRLDYQDRFNGQAWRLENAQLDIDSLHDAAQLDFKGRLQTVGRAVDLAATAPFTRIDDQIDIPQLDILATHQSVELGEIKAEGTGKLQLNLATMLAQGQDLKLALGSTHPHSKSELLVPALTVSLDEMLAPNASLTGLIDYEKTRYSFSSHFADLNVKPGSIAAGKTHHDFKWQVGPHSLDMSLQSPLQLEQPSRLSMKPITLTAQLKSPTLPRGQLRAQLSGELDGQLDSAQLELRVNGELDGSRLATTIKQQGFMLPRHEFQLSVDKLDLNRYLPESRSQGPTALFDNQQTFQLGWMDYINISGKTNIGELTVGNFKIGGISADVIANSEKLQLDKLSADIYEGQLSGEISLLREKQPKLQVRQQLTGMQIKPLMSDLFNFSRIEGSGNGWVQLESRGTSMKALRNSLTGNVAARLEKGALLGIDLVKTLQTLPVGTADWTTELDDAPDQRTTFSSLSAQLQLQDGIARNQDLKLASSLVNVQGNGKFDITQGLIDYSLDVNPNPAAFNKLGKVNIPFKITGPVGKPVYSLDFNAIVKGKKTESEKQQTLKKELGKQLNAILPRVN